MILLFFKFLERRLHFLIIFLLRSLVRRDQPFFSLPFCWECVYQLVLRYYWFLFVCFVCFVALRPKSTAMVIAGRSVHLTTLFPGQA